VTLNRVQALLTALIFDHALRVRVVASPSQGKDQEEQKPVDGHSGQDGTPNDDDLTPTPTPTAAPPAPGTNGTGSNNSNPTAHIGLSGLITDLATSDLQNILGGNQFLLIFLDAPLETLLTVGFLYSVLGWSAFAGLAVLLLLLPLPAYLSSRMAAAQGRKMKCTDARVGRLGEALGALRMLKLGGAGYTDAVRREIAEAREEELKEEWRVKLVDAVNNIVSFAIPLAHMVTSFVLYVSWMCDFARSGMINCPDMLLMDRLWL
jgi:ABC-type multidrug transport system fused ATPase/permease subunit